MADEGRKPRCLDTEALRALFPVTRWWTYLNHAFSATRPGPVRSAMADYLAARVVISEREPHVRVSPHCYSTEEDIARIGEVLASLH